MRLLGALLCVGLAAATALAAEGFEKLYDGKEIKGWWAKDGQLTAWKSENGALITPKENGGWLTTDKEYGDFILKCDWKIEAGGNSGIGLRFPKDGRPWLEGVEIQILDDDAPMHANLKPYQYCGSVYGVSGPTRKAARPVGQWNTFEIRCEGPITEIKLNGIVVNRVNADEVTKAELEGSKPLRERVRKGHIGLQAYGPQTQFRNVEIRELK
ncbi:MAG: 3-keto-disaccharide hydrolase [Actinomycetota bacterium]